MAGTGEARPLLVYHLSWTERPSVRPDHLDLARLPGSIDVVALAFARPDAEYAGDLAAPLAGSGLEYPVTGLVLRQAVADLHRRNPGQKVILSIGGATYTAWDRLSVAAIALLVRDLGLDGVDLDIEPADPGCRRDAHERISCASDSIWRDSIRRLRGAMPRPMLLAMTGWSVGAYGEGAWREATPTSPWTGVMLGVLRSPEAALVDMLSIMAYDTGPEYDAMQAFSAYRAVWAGPLLVGVSLEAAALLPAAERLVGPRHLMQRAAAEPAGGIMMYGWASQPASAAALAAEATTLGCRMLRANAAAGCGGLSRQAHPGVRTTP
jgi:hypothetical protein